MSDKDFTIEPEAMRIIIDWMKEYKPTIVVELGSGESTKKLAKHCDILYTYEDNPAYLKKQPINVIQKYAPLKEGWYNAEFPEDIDLLIIDGPCGRPKQLVRMPSKELLMKLKGPIFLHDTIRPEEIEIAHKLGKPTFYDTKYGIAKIECINGSKE